MYYDYYYDFFNRSQDLDLYRGYHSINYLEVINKIYRIKKQTDKEEYRKCKFYIWFTDNDVFGLFENSVLMWHNVMHKTQRSILKTLNDLLLRQKSGKPFYISKRLLQIEGLFP